MEGLGINPGYLLVQIIAFIVIYVLLTRFLYDPLGRVLSERRQRIAKGLEDAAAAANARLNAEKEAEGILVEARTEAAHIVEEGRASAEQVAKNIEAEARAEAEKILADARVRAEGERDAQLGGLRDQVTAISLAVAQRLVGSLDEKQQKVLINDFFTRVPESAKSLSGNVEVVSAMPLSDAEQKKVKQATKADDIAFKVDPNILGGLILRAGDRVVDGSVRSNLNDLAGQLK